MTGRQKSTSYIKLQISLRGFGVFLCIKFNGGGVWWWVFVLKCLCYFMTSKQETHHTTTDVAPVGSGEISLSHNGVLFLDELPFTLGKAK